MANIPNATYILVTADNNNIVANIAPGAAPGDDMTLQPLNQPGRLINIVAVGPDYTFVGEAGVAGCAAIAAADHIVVDGANTNFQIIYNAQDATFQIKARNTNLFWTRILGAAGEIITLQEHLGKADLRQTWILRLAQGPA